MEREDGGVSEIFDVALSSLTSTSELNDDGATRLLWATLGPGEKVNNALVAGGVNEGVYDGVFN